jgi:hypothetical protein
MKTSYFAKYKGLDGPGVCIAGKAPEYNTEWGYLIYKPLAPKYWFFKKYKEDGDENYYTEQYYKCVLNQLDPVKIYEEFKDCVLLCYEKPGDFCHRRIVAKWLETELGIVVPEITYVRKI